MRSLANQKGNDGVLRMLRVMQSDMRCGSIGSLAKHDGKNLPRLLAVTTQKKVSSASQSEKWRERRERDAQLPPGRGKRNRESSAEIKDSLRSEGGLILVVKGNVPALLCDTFVSSRVRPAPCIPRRTFSVCVEAIRRWPAARRTVAC